MNKLSFFCPLFGDGIWLTVEGLLSNLSKSSLFLGELRPVVGEPSAPPLANSLCRNLRLDPADPAVPGVDLASFGVDPAQGNALKNLPPFLTDSYLI